MLKSHFKIHRSFSTFWKKLISFEENEDREFARLMKYGANAAQTRRMVSVYKDGALRDLRREMGCTQNAGEMDIFRYLRRSAIINSINKMEFTS